MPDQTTDYQGRNVTRMWRNPMPDPEKPAAGFPILDGVRHTTIFSPTREIGAYNHHPQIVNHDGQFHAIWSNHPCAEDGPGQRVLYSRSKDGEQWSSWSEAFPSPGPVGDWTTQGLVHTAGRWMTVDDRLYAVALLHANRGFINKLDPRDRQIPVPRRDDAHPNLAREGFSCIVREMCAGGTWGPYFPLADHLPPETLPYVLASEPRIAGRIEALFQQPDCIPTWDFEGRYARPTAWDGHPLCEPTSYLAADGSWRLLLRDLAYSHRLYVSGWDPEQKAWLPAEPTDIPDSPSLSCARTLEDGRVLLIGNPTATRFDNPTDPAHYVRDPLTVSISPTGETFDRVLALRYGPYEWNVPPSEVIGRGHGYQYPCAILHGDELWVIYSIGKESIGVSHVPLTALR